MHIVIRNRNCSNSSYSL